jgi:hypothetical protein
MENTYEISQVVPEFKKLSGNEDFVSAALFTITGTSSSGKVHKVTRRLEFDPVYPNEESLSPFVPYKYWGESGLKTALLSLCYDKGIIELIDENLK